MRSHSEKAKVRRRYGFRHSDHYHLRRLGRNCREYRVDTRDNDPWTEGCCRRRDRPVHRRRARYGGKPVPLRSEAQPPTGHAYGRNDVNYDHRARSAVDLLIWWRRGGCFLFHRAGLRRTYLSRASWWLVDVATDLRRPCWRRRNSSDCRTSHVTGRRIESAQHTDDQVGIGTKLLLGLS